MKVMVYGTLKSDGRLFPALETAKFLGEHVTPPEYTMVSLGWFPGVIHHGTTPITGEVYEVDEPTFKRLDQIEGYPSLYLREKTPTPYGEAWMYIYNVHKIDKAANVITSGNWNNNQKAV